MTTKRTATPETIDGACELAQIMGGYSDDEIYCDPRHCEHCLCNVDCGHQHSWECAASALGIGDDSVDLWLQASHAVDSAFGIAAGGNLDEDQILSANELTASAPNGSADYEAEALLRTGWLPRGWRAG